MPGRTGRAPTIVAMVVAAAMLGGLACCSSRPRDAADEAPGAARAESATAAADVAADGGEDRTGAPETEEDGITATAEAEAHPVATAAEAEALARQTEAVQAFLARYSPCEGCTIRDEPGDPPRTGCVSWEVERDCLARDAPGCRDIWRVTYRVARSCSFRYGPSDQPLMVEIDPASGFVWGTVPGLPFVATPDYCETDADCRCLSGSGVEFLGCANYFHAPTHFAGSYECDMCSCVEHRCGSG